MLSGSLANDALLLVCRYVCAVSPYAGKSSSPTHKPHSSVIANTVRVDVQDEPTVPYQERGILRAERAPCGCEMSERFPENLSFAPLRKFLNLLTTGFVFELSATAGITAGINLFARDSLPCVPNSMFKIVLFSTLYAYFEGLCKQYRETLSVCFFRTVDSTPLDTRHSMSTILTSYQGFKLIRPFFKPSFAVPNEQSVPPIRENWCKISPPHVQYARRVLILQSVDYPADIANDLKDFDLPRRIKEEVYACAWEYARCVIPQYTNWNRYVAFMRVIVIGIVAECKGDLVQVSLGDNLLGYNLTALLDELFQGTTEQ